MIEQAVSVPWWGLFNEGWYRSRYYFALPMIEDVYSGHVESYYEMRGRILGHSPNPYFDEQWYLQEYPAIADKVKKKEFKSGFDHYCQEGYLNPDFSPHYLFSEKKYREINPDFLNSTIIPAGYVNGYDHYLKKGDRELFSTSPFFDPLLYLCQKENREEVSQLGPYQYLLEIEPEDADRYHLSWYFDPNWYLKSYPEVLNLLKHKRFINSLHHYFSNKTPLSFSPLTWFSEEFYCSLYEDVVSAVSQERKFRTGYSHFISHGIEEGRQPCEALDLKAYSLEEKVQKALQTGFYHNAFEHWVAHNTYGFNDNLKIFITSSEGEVEEIPESEQSASEIVSEPEEKESPVPLEVNTSEQVRKTGILWQNFDEGWYVRRYVDVATHMKALELDSIEEYYLSFGRYAGHSPNPYFDEQWYLDNYPKVKELVQKKDIASGFEHYCQGGYHTHSPHWLFSETYYMEKNTHLNSELLKHHNFINGYDHYLKTGDMEGLSGSLFFDPYFFLAQFGQPIPDGVGPFRHYVNFLLPSNNRLRLSWYFDPEWYVKTYPEVEELIHSGKFLNPIHHYLTNNQPFYFSPLFWFDEIFYDKHYQLELEKNKVFETYRNGYAHFICEGIQLLWRPRDDIDLKKYKKEIKKEQKENIEDEVNIFIHWLNHYHNRENFLENNKDETVVSDEKDSEIKELIQGKKNNPGNLIYDNFDELKIAEWLEFDEEWYLRRYSDVSEKLQSCGLENGKTYYQEVGAFLGHSPNPYFDEKWYVNSHIEVQKAIQRGVFQTGFEHYCAKGYLLYSPHWLYSDSYYLGKNPELGRESGQKEEYVNVYDHYLKKGDQLHRSGSIMFDPKIYQRACYQQGKVEKMDSPFRSYLVNLCDEDAEEPVSLYFDPKWYLQTYPEVAEAIKQGEYCNALHHYITNPTPLEFNPSAWFSESFYAEAFPDVKAAVLQSSQGDFRNCFEHFVLYGALECRQPHPELDLNAYFWSDHVRDDIENNLFRDAFAHWVYYKSIEDWLKTQPEDVFHNFDKETKEAREQFRKEAQFALPIFTKGKLNFSYKGKPEVSVIMLLHNQFSVTLNALSSLRSNFNGGIQLLLGDNHSSDNTKWIQDTVIGAEIQHFPINLGYGKACNILLKQVEAPIVIFLNNDTKLYPQAIDILCQRLLSAPDIGIVGGKIIHPDGKLQEAGSIIWRDGGTVGYLCGADPLLPEANFVREVDYCSGAMIAVRSSLLEQLEGFSPIFYPAYFEDADLCVRSINAGYKVIYDPNATVEHMEYASSDPICANGLIRRNHQLFVKEHRNFLKHQHPQHTSNISLARQRKGDSKYVLFIEDRVPLHHLGSGYARSNDIVKQMEYLGYKVTVYPLNNYYPDLYGIYKDFSETVEILYNRNIEMISQFFEDRAGYYDIVWIGRTHNLNRLLPLLGKANRYLPQNGLILDTEVVAAPRTYMHSNIFGKKEKDSLQEAIQKELACARHCQEIVAVNAVDANYIKQAGFDEVNILGHMMPARATHKSWKERKDFLFVGAIHDDLSPNYDGLQWLLTIILPYLVEQLGENFKITIAGYVHPQVNLSKFAKFPQVELLGAVDDLTELYNNHRVFIAPTRFAGGIPYKLHEAASYGLPIACSQILVNQLAWEDGVDILGAPDDNPVLFASQVVRLYTEESLWNKIRKNALERIKIDCDKKQFTQDLEKILNKIIL